MNDLPHLVVEEPKRSKTALVGIAVLSLLVLTLPLGVFLVSQRTQLAPRAAIFEKIQTPLTGIFLESGSRLQFGGALPVDIYIKSEVDPINLVNAQIKFDPKQLTIEKIATSSAQGSPNGQLKFTKWLQVSSNQDQGLVKIICGLPSPGIKTNLDTQEKIYLGTLFFKPKATGSTVLMIDPASQILRNLDSQNIFKTGNDLVLNLANIAPVQPDSTPSSKAKTNSLSQPLLLITNITGGSNFSYFTPLQIKWSAFNVDRIAQINLLINDELFGPIGQNIPNSGNFSWTIPDNLPLAYIQYGNTFKLRIVGVSKSGESAEATAGPFGILGLEQIPGGVPSDEALSSNPLTIGDGSRLLSNYLIFPFNDKSVDLNKDEAVNDLDFYLLRKNLLGRGVIK